MRRLGRILALIAAGLGLLALTAPGAASAAGLPPLRHVFVIVLENKGFDETFGYDSAAQYLSVTLPSQGALLPNYYGVTHQSNANYIAMISGQGANPQNQADCQFFDDFTPGTIGSDGQALGTGCVFPAPIKTISDQLTAHGLTWKAYMEDMGNGGAGVATTCRHPAVNSQDSTQSARNGDEYATRHNPFVYFHSLLDSGVCAKYDVPLSQLPADLASAATTASYSFVVPNLCDDGHDSPCVDGRPGGLVSADAWLKQWVPRIVASPAYRAGGLLLVTFDESDGSDASACCGEQQFPDTPNNGGEYPGMGGGRVGAVALSPFIDPGTVDEQAYNHFSMLRSVEDIFGLDHLGYAGQAGLQPFGGGLFTCYAPGAKPIKSVQLGQLAHRPQLVEVKLWRQGVVSVSVRLRRRRARTRRLVRSRAAGPCQVLKVPLPRGHGRIVVAARAGGQLQRVTIFY